MNLAHRRFLAALFAVSLMAVPALFPEFKGTVFAEAVDGVQSDKPVKVFVLAGQSNMEGQGVHQSRPEAKRGEVQPGVPYKRLGHGRQVQAPARQGRQVGCP